MKKTFTHFVSLITILCGIFSIQLNAQTGCHASFASDQSGNPLTVDFTDLSTSPNSITSWHWDLGDGNTSSEQNPSHTYAEHGTYLVCLTITDDHGCTNHVCHNVLVEGPPPGVCHAAFAAHQPDPDQQTIEFTDQSTSDGTIGSWNWDFGDGNTSSEQDPIYTYDEPGTYTVCLTITDDDDGCTDHICHHVVVTHPAEGFCHASFIFHQPDPEQYTINFTDQSTSDGTIGSWSWDFGDGNNSTEQNPTHTYAEPGTYQVCLTITDDDGSCTNHVCHHVVVHHPPVGVCHASYSVNQPNLSQLTFDFTDLSTSDGTIGTWAWDFGDGSTSTEQNPSHTYAVPGVYLVCLFITDDDGGCTSHVCHHVVVPHPIVTEQNAGLRSETESSSFGSGSYISSRKNDQASVEQATLFTYPNPFISTTTLQYELTRDAVVQIEIYDMLGNKLNQLFNGKVLAGMHTKEIAGDNLTPGSYLIKMIIGGELYTKKISVIR